MTTPITYDPNVPQNRSDNLPTTQPMLQDNFQVLYNAFVKNHVALDAASNAGNHAFIDLFQQDNAQQIGTSEISIYSKEVEGQTTQLFLRLQGGQEVQLTNYQLYSLIPTNTQISYFTFLPGGILVYFGYVNATGREFTINLQPPVAKNIITCSFCRKNQTPTNPGFRPYVFIPTAIDGFYKSIVINSPGGNLASTFYIVMVNL